MTEPERDQLRAAVLQASWATLRTQWPLFIELAEDLLSRGDGPGFSHLLESYAKQLEALRQLCAACCKVPEPRR